MPIDAAIPLQVRAPEVQNPTDLFAKTLSLGQLMQQRQLHQQQIQENELQMQQRRDAIKKAEIATHDQELARQAYMTAKGDPKLTIQQAIQLGVGPEAIQSLDKHFADVAEKYTKIEQDKLPVRKYQNEQMMGWHQQALKAAENPSVFAQSWPQLYAAAVQIDPENAKHMDPNAPPPADQLRLSQVGYATDAYYLQQQEEARKQEAEKRAAAMGAPQLAVEQEKVAQIAREAVARQNPTDPAAQSAALTADQRNVSRNLTDTQIAWMIAHGTPKEKADASAALDIRRKFLQDTQRPPQVTPPSHAQYAEIEARKSTRLQRAEQDLSKKIEADGLRQAIKVTDVASRAAETDRQTQLQALYADHETNKQRIEEDYQNETRALKGSAPEAPPVAAVTPGRNNPGNIRRDANSFNDYDTPEAGWNALKSDLAAKIAGKTAHGLDESSTIADLAKVWAPAGDGANNPDNWAANVAAHLKVPATTPIGQFKDRVDDLARAVAVAEGTKVPAVAATPTPAPPPAPAPTSPPKVFPRSRLKAFADANHITPAQAESRLRGQKYIIQ